MRLPLRRIAACAFVALAVPACSEDDDAGNGGFKAADPAFDGICRGVLRTSQKALPSLPVSGGGIGWGGVNNPVAPSGTSFLLATDSFGSKITYRGYLFVADGRAAQMNGDFTEGLIKDTDFTTDCDATKKGRDTLLVATVVRPNADLTGDACTLPLGTDIFELSVARTGQGPITLAGAGLGTLCGFEKGYTDSLLEVDLITK